MAYLPNMRNVLRGIADVAEDIQRRTQSFAKPELASSSCSSTTEICSPNHLPTLEPIVSELTTAGIDIEKATRLSDAFIRAGQQLQKIHSVNARKLLHKFQSMGTFPSSQENRLLEVDRKLYLDRLTTWKAGILQKACAASSSSVEISHKAERGEEKKSFNNDFVPFLELCFARNRFPRKADKILLAEKSGMSYQQIHIWFQNRRSRMKKHEASSQRAHREVQSERNCGSAEKLLDLDVADTTIDSQSSRSSSVTLVKNETFSVCAPSYAFPMTYPPEHFTEADPFPCRFGDFSSFGKPCWPRQPTSRPQETIADMSTLCLAFAGLRIGDATQSSLQKKSNRTRKSAQVSSEESGFDVTSPYTVRPLRAPLMSLIRNFASRVVHRSGKPSEGVQRSQRNIIATSVVECGAQPSPLKTRCQQTSASRGSAVSADQNSAPLAHSPNDPISPSAHNSSVASARASSADQTPKVKKSIKKPSSSRRVPTASACKRSKGRSAPVVQAVEPSAEPSTSHPSPTASVGSLPSLSYSSESSSASSYSQSPTTSFVSLSDDGFLPSLDLYQPNNSSLTLPPAQGHFDDFPPSMFVSSGEIPFDFSKGPLDLTFNMDLPTYPSYSESLDSISRGLQSSPDIAPPALTLDLPSFTI